MANSVVLESYPKACAYILSIVQTYRTLWEQAVRSKLQSFHHSFVEAPFKNSLGVTFSNADFYSFC